MVEIYKATDVLCVHIAFQTPNLLSGYDMGRRIERVDFVWQQARREKDASVIRLHNYWRSPWAVSRVTLALIFARF